MSATDEFKESLRPVLLHEAAHNIVARQLGLPSGDVVITIDPGGASGGSEVNLKLLLPTLQALEAYLPKRSKMLYAGCIAQSFDSQGFDEVACEQCARSNGSNDEAKARENLRLWANIRFGDAFDHFERMQHTEEEWRAEALRLVEQHHDDIKRLAAALLDRVDSDDMSVRMTQAEIESMLGASSDAH